MSIEHNQKKYRGMVEKVSNSNTFSSNNLEHLYIKPAQHSGEISFTHYVHLWLSVSECVSHLQPIRVSGYES